MKLHMITPEFPIKILNLPSKLPESTNCLPKKIKEPPTLLICESVGKFYKYVKKTNVKIHNLSSKTISGKIKQ